MENLRILIRLLLLYVLEILLQQYLIAVAKDEIFEFLFFFKTKVIGPDKIFYII